MRNVCITRCCGVSGRVFKRIWLHRASSCQRYPIGWSNDQEISGAEVADRSEKLRHRGVSNAPRCSYG